MSKERVRLKQAKDVLAELLKHDTERIRREAQQEVWDAHRQWPECKLGQGHLSVMSRQFLLREMARMAEWGRESNWLQSKQMGVFACAVSNLTADEIDELVALVSRIAKSKKAVA